MADALPAPDRTVPAERLAEALVPGLAPAVAERLLASSRLGARARAWADRAVASAIATLRDADRMLAEAGPEGLHHAASLAGSVWHAGRVRGLMLARDLQPFLEQHGPQAREMALLHGNLSPKVPPGQGSLADQVMEDGMACVSAWIGALPAEVARAVRLVIPADQERAPGELHRLHGPAILRAVASHLPLAEPA